MSLRILMLGKPKHGKTGSLASLASRGWKIRYLDFDNNPDPLFAFTKPEHRGNIERVACHDEYFLQEKGGTSDKDVVAKLRTAAGWVAMYKALDKWPTDDSNPREWDPRSNILVIDSLTSLTEAKTNMQLRVANRDHLARSDYFIIQNCIKDFVHVLQGAVVCPVFVLGHLRQIGPDLGVDDRIKSKEMIEKVLNEKIDRAREIQWEWGPITIGSAQVMTFASLFTGTIVVHSHDRGRYIHLHQIPEFPGFALGLPIPGLKREYPIESGMDQIMEAWLASSIGASALQPPATNAKGQ